MRPAFMDYFDKQDSNKAAQQQENYNHNQPQEQPGYHIQSKNVFPDNWKVPQDGDFDFVSNVFHEPVVVLLYWRGVTHGGSRCTTVVKNSSD